MRQRSYPMRIARIYTARPDHCRYGVVVNDASEIVTIRIPSAKGPYELRFSKKTGKMIDQRNNWFPLRYREH